jgi:TIR domain-containing protein
MPTIMLSYRRDDSKWIAGRIFDRLEDHYGRGNVFMDIDAIPVGLDFREHLKQSLQRCDILLAIVGPKWLGTDEHGHHAIADETDWVRIEIETALAKKIPVIPILIDRLRMPKATELPEGLRNFAFRQAAEVDSGVDFRTHLDRLIRSMDQYLQGQSLPLSTSAPAPIPRPDTHLPAAGENRTVADRKADAAQAVSPLPPRLSRRAAVRTALIAVNSAIGIASLLFLSELSAFLSERAVGDSDRLFLLSLTSLPFGAAGLILIGWRLYAYLRLLGDKTRAGLAIAALGVFLVALVPAFFHATHPPDQYAAAAAWPFVLLGGLGLVFIAAVLISHSAAAEAQNRDVKGWAGAAITLLVLAWLDSSPTSSYLPMLDWRVRSVLIFTCVFVGSTIIVVLASKALLRFTRNGFAKNIAGE